MNINIGNMQLAMAKKRLKITELAQLSGVSRNTLSAIRKEGYACRPDTVGAIAKALEVDVEYLIEN